MTHRLRRFSTVYIIPASLFFFAAHVSAADSVYRHIENIVVTEQAKSERGTAAEDCASFRLKKLRILQVLQSAREVDVRTFAHEMDYAPCSVEGSLTLRNGLTGTWKIEMSGRVRVVFEDEHILLLQCERCTKPFVKRIALGKASPN